MRIASRWPRLLSVAGAIAFLAGAIDPLEGGVVVLVGSALLVAGEFARREPGRRRLWLGVFVLIACGVAAMLGLSALGGVGGRSGRSWWWALLILPYPAGWLLGVGILVAAFVRRLRQRAAERRLA